MTFFRKMQDIQPCLTVSDLWIANTKNRSANWIEQVPICNHEGPDILCWRPSTSGMWTSKEAYNRSWQDAGETRYPATTQGNQGYKTHTHPSTAKTCMKPARSFSHVSKHLHGGYKQALATGEQVGYYSKHIDKDCIRCGWLEKWRFNFFFPCSFSRAFLFSATPLILADATNGGQVIQAQIEKLLSSNANWGEIQRVITLLWYQRKAMTDQRFNKEEWSIQI